MIGARATFAGVTTLIVGLVVSANAQDAGDSFADRVLVCAAMYRADEFSKYSTGVPHGRAQTMGEAFNNVIPYDTIETENAFLDRYDIVKGEFMKLFYDNEGLDENMPETLVQTIAMCEDTYTEVLAVGLNR